MASGFTMVPYTCPRDYGGKSSKPGTASSKVVKTSKGK